MYEWLQHLQVPSLPTSTSLCTVAVHDRIRILFIHSFPLLQPSDAATRLHDCELASGQQQQ
jgi:hypothetical protein